MMLARLRRILRLPPGTGALLRPKARVSVVLSIGGSVVTAALDMLGVAALVPLTQLLLGSNTDEGALGFVADVTGVSERQTLAFLILGLVVLAFVLKALLTLAIRWWQLGVLSREAAWASATLLRGYLRPPYELHLVRPISEMVRTLGDGVQSAYNGVVGGLLAIVADGLTVIGLTVVLLVASPLPAAIAIAYLGLVSGLMARQLGRRSRELAKRYLAEGLESFRAVLHSLGGVKEILVRHNAEVFVARYGLAQDRLVEIRRRMAFFAEGPKYVLELSFVTGVALLAGLTFLSEGPETAVTSMALFVAAGFRLLPGVVRMISSATAVRAGMPGLELVVADLPRYVHLEPEESDQRPEPLVGSLRLEGVSYRYPSAHTDVVHDVSLDIPQGSTLAVVGMSGSGKTTLVNLILGLLRPTAGSITVGGRDIHDDLWAWQAGIALVPQPVYAFEGTLRDNVTFGMPAGEVDDMRVLRAIDRAALSELLDTRGLDTELGERGVALSGGQQQRIGLARALYHEPSLLVLDEATSALDSITEARVTESIHSLGASVTKVVIAHRLSTVRHADQLVFLDDGRVSAIGTFEEVQRSNPTFRRLVELGSLNSTGGHER